MLKLRHQIDVFANVLYILSKIIRLGVLCLCRRKKLIIVGRPAHLGDLIALEPISRQIKSKYPDCCILWLTEHNFVPLVRMFPNVDRVLGVTCPSVVAILQKLKFLPIIIPDVGGRYCNECIWPILNVSKFPEINFENYYDYGTLLEVFQLCAGFPRKPEAPGLMKKPTSESTPYIIVAAGSNDPQRKWNDENWLELVSSLCEMGHRVIEVGYTTAFPNFQHRLYVNRCHYMPVDQLAGLIGNAIFFIGIDSGPAHLANAYRIPSVVILGKYRKWNHYRIYNGFFADNPQFLHQHGDRLGSLSAIEVLNHFIRVRSFGEDCQRDTLLLGTP